jgi:gentisate 1,2-dioxygenase
MPTLGLSLESIPAGKATPTRRVVANNIYAVVRGRCRVHTDEGVLAENLGHGDVISMPLWREHRIGADDDTIVLRVTDEPVYRALGLFRDRSTSMAGAAR